jgi:YggT family protein
MVLDAVTDLTRFIDYFVYIYVLVIFVRIILSWIRLPYSFNPLVRFVGDVTDPYLRLWRRVLPSFGPLDLSPMVGIIALLVVESLLDAALNRIH